MSDKPTIADVSMPAICIIRPEEFGFDIAKDHPAIGAWLERMKALPGWKHPYELMPGYPFGTGRRRKLAAASVQPRRPVVGFAGWRMRIWRVNLVRRRHRRGLAAATAASLR